MLSVQTKRLPKLTYFCATSESLIQGCSPNSDDDTCAAPEELPAPPEHWSSQFLSMVSVILLVCNQHRPQRDLLISNGASSQMYCFDDLLKMKNVLPITVFADDKTTQSTENIMDPCSCQWCLIFHMFSLTSWRRGVKKRVWCGGLDSIREKS